MAVLKGKNRCLLNTVNRSEWWSGNPVRISTSRPSRQ